MPLKLGWSRYVRLVDGDLNHRQPILRFWTQPWHLYLRARVYYIVSGPFRVLFRMHWLGNLEYKVYSHRFPENDIRSMPMDVRITLRRHHYFGQGRKTLGTIPVSREVYDTHKGGDG